jgi:DNA-binding beta-propeller fold protein YncE
VFYGAGNHRYELVDGWARIPEGYSFFDIGGLSIDAQDRLYVLNRGSRPVMVFDREGNLVNSFGEGLFNRPHGVCIGQDGSIYCTDDGNHTVSKFTPQGEMVASLGTKDKPSDTGYVKKQGVSSIKKGGPPFNRPTGVALSSSGEVYVSDGYGNARVHKFTPDGRLLFSWGEPGRGPGQFMLPHSVRVDRRERVWVCDRENSRIQIFSPEGTFLEQWDDIGGKPTDLFLESDQTVYVSIKSEDRPHGVSIFTVDGRLITRWGEQGKDQKIDEAAMFATPHAIAVDSRGDIYLGESRHELGKVDAGNRALRKFVRRRC